MRSTALLPLALLALAIGAVLGWTTGPAVGAGGFRAYVPLTARGADLSVPPPSSVEVIEAAVKSGQLSPDDALVYKVFAGFGDPRLPVQYRGDDSRLHAGAVITDAAARYAQLTDAQREAIGPYLIPPIYQNSWHAQRAATRTAAAAPPTPARSASATRRAAVSKPACDATATGWAFKEQPGGKVRVWYETKNAGDDAVAADAAWVYDTTIWPKLTGLMGRTPRSDAGDSCNGGSGQLDVYLVELSGPDGLTTNHGVGCEYDSAFILVNRSLSTEKLVAAMAHELFHAIVWAIDVSAFCLSDYKWLNEASATWAIDYVYPTQVGNREHDFARYLLDRPDKPLDTFESEADLHPYGAYLFPRWLTGDKHAAAGTIKQIWDATQGQSKSLKALDSAIAGGLAEQWPKFALRAWNRGPVNEFEKWDNLSRQAKPELETDVLVGDGGDYEFKLEGDLKRLTARYYRFRFPSDAVRTVAFYNGVTYKLSVEDPKGHRPTFVARDATADQKKGAKVQALVKYAGKDWEQPEDWTNSPIKSFCRDARAERLEELVVVVSNSEFEDADRVLQPLDQPSTLRVSNLPCWRLNSQTTYDHRKNTADDRITEVVSANVIWEREVQPVVADSEGRYYLLGTLFRPLSGSITWSLNRWAHILTIFNQRYECTWTGSGTMVPDREQGELHVHSLVRAPSEGWRAYWGYAYSDAPGDPVKIDCTHDEGDGVGGYGQSWLSISEYFPWQKAPAADGGALEGTETYSAPEIGTVTESWRFTPIRE